MSANDVQVAGDHYKVASYQHWDFVLNTGMGYLEGNVTKYVSRWLRKGGAEDLKKAVHYLDKLIENAHVAPRPRFDSMWRGEEARRYCQENALGAMETEVLLILADWSIRPHLEAAKRLIVQTIEACAKQVPLEDSNKHGSQEFGD